MGPQRIWLATMVLGLGLAGCGESQQSAVELSQASGATSAQPTGIVFMGDSITDLWGSLPLEISRAGVPGDTSRGMALRFQRDALSLRPRVIHILAGTNDVRLDDSTDVLQLSNMASAAAADGACVILGTIPPITNGSLGLPAPKDVKALNVLVSIWNGNVRALTLAAGYKLADYHTVLTAPGAPPLTELLPDGIHPSLVGYKLMREEFELRLADCQ